MAVDPGQMRVLIVDGEEEILELVGEYLRVRGCVVQTAMERELALPLLRAGRVDVVMVDHRPPQLDALALVADVARLDHPIATIVTTGVPTVEAAIAAFRCGALDYVVKPFKLRALFASLSAAVEHLETQRQALRASERLAFYELAQGNPEPGWIVRLAAALAPLLVQETDAGEAGVWLRRTGGWERVAAAGTGGVLAALDPQEFRDLRQGAAGLAVFPIRGKGQPLGLLAVAGGVARATQHIERLQLLGRVFAGALSRALTQDRPA